MASMDEPSRTILKAHLLKAFPHWGEGDKPVIDEWVAKCRWSSLDCYWWVDMHGIHMGIEVDGYVHS